MAPGMIKLVCQVPGCNRVFKNKSGPGFISPRAQSPIPGAEDEQENPGFVPEEGTWVDMGNLFRVFHPHLTGLKCDTDGTFIDQDAPPSPRMNAPSTDWTPYQNRVEFETAEFLFMWNQMSAKQIDMLLDLWAATLIKHNNAPPFANHKDMFATIDATLLGDIPWQSFAMSYNGIKPQDNVPPWMTAQYNVWYRDPLELVRNMLANPDFNGEIEFSPYRDYTTDNKRYWKNLMSGDWAWNQVDLIAQNQETHGSTFVPLIMGSNKTIVSVATGHTEYHPLYLLIGNIFNSVRRTHRNGVVLVGFLAIPKSTKEHNNCRWCPRCLADSKDLDRGQPCLHRREEHMELLIDRLTHKQLWSEYGIISDLVPFTNDFPRADIHELLSPDILHQIIKGTFKDHLVDWVEDYLTATHGAHLAAEIMDDIDRSGRPIRWVTTLSRRTRIQAVDW
ncbi:uncharacterized protein F5891DRAFT_977657 [Suillus fuscotomentosus]|uniref:Uncharacterized protein n=1 Tax=Suillus fuscotomentosus TaxID=1912939 RepID=A0AAD4HMV5_9AGAM|nr:uncharacterized protein F5891DRAFT_977657 [Suillus fuscotomentosus]KAG1903540.1 hypothetical protein F5891DRAFT_977657 [Suillus fuscotomentosus]